MREVDIARLYELRAAKKAIEAEENEILATLKDLAVDDYLVGPFLVKAQPNRRFNARKAEAMLTDSQKRKVTKRVVDGTLMKVHYPDLYVAAQDEFSAKIKVELP